MVQCVTAGYNCAKIPIQMKQAVNLRHIVAGGLVLASALNCAAMSLERAKGMALIGRPLDLSVQVKLDPTDDPAALCAVAEVFYADRRVEAGQVQVTSERGTSAEEATVRIRSSALVDEPVVTVSLKAGCKQGLTRRYVLLSELPGQNVVEVPVASARAAVEPAGRPYPATSGGGEGGMNQGAMPPVSRTERVRVTKEKPPLAVKPAAPAESRRAEAKAPTRSVVRNPETPTSAGKPRLKLDSAEILIARDPVLRASTELLTVPQETGSRRVEAAALWRALNATPDSVMRDEQRMLALQTDVTAMRLQNQKNETAIADLKARLQTAQAERYQNALVYGLLAALLLALGAAAYLWTRGRRQSKPQWWGIEDQEFKDASAMAPEPMVATGRSSVDLDVDLSASSVPDVIPEPVVRKPAARAGATPPRGADFQGSLSGGGRAVKVEELLDVQQQADFFLSLGQYEQAIATLRNHISDNVETSALAYLDLLKVFHMQGRKKDYELVRKEFNAAFNSEVPEFAAFGKQTKGLITYESVMPRIVSLWPTEEVLEFIEESIFRKPGQGNDPFDLEAYDELLMLYVVAKDIVKGKRGGSAFDAARSGLAASSNSQGSSWAELERLRFQATSMQPLPVSPTADAGSGSSNLGVLSSRDVEVDIDLSEFPSEFYEAPAPSAPVEKGGPKPAVPDFDLFDLATQAHAASKRKP
jgi:tetratricopeptide (TPR) repeat protein